MFTKDQVKKLVIRLTQSTESLLYGDKNNNQERNRYNYYKRGSNVLGVAHCDYVSEAWSKPSIVGTNVVSGQVDDRVGVWLLLDILPEMLGVEFDVLLTTDEEIGRSTAADASYSESMEYGWTFQFDRRGTDFVDYELASKEFIDAFKKETGIKHGKGSFSDICRLDEYCGSRVNIGTGYYGEHFPDAYVDLKDCWKQVQAFRKFFLKHKDSMFPFSSEHRGWHEEKEWYMDTRSGRWEFDEKSGEYEFVSSIKKKGIL